ncbi:nascent polypeptide-associated complex protein [Candidatus Woesearchaeota archaeon]|nr:nascent polypeptide-associated complex protein [Candidatus Woesearchaeota archaeon]
MIPKINPKQMEKMMKQLGVKQEEIDAEEVVIKCRDKELIIKNPSVQKVNMMGQESLQITGDIEEKIPEKFSDDDVKLVAEQTGCSEETARETLENNDGDIAKTILEIKHNNV